MIRHLSRVKAAGLGGGSNAQFGRNRRRRGDALARAILRERVVDKVAFI